MRNLLKKPISELSQNEIELIAQQLIEARSILNDAVNCSAVCNVKEYDDMRSKAFKFLSESV